MYRLIDTTDIIDWTLPIAAASLPRHLGSSYIPQRSHIAAYLAEICRPMTVSELRELYWYGKWN
jgi:hypothetical protein